MVRKCYALEDSLYPQLSMPGKQEGQVPAEVEADMGVEAELREHQRAEYSMAAGRRWREVLGQFDRARGSPEMLLFSVGVSENMKMYITGEYRKAYIRRERDDAGNRVPQARVGAGRREPMEEGSASLPSVGREGA